jgi:hypothetical protein
MYFPMTVPQFDFLFLVVLIPDSAVQPTGRVIEEQTWSSKGTQPYIFKSFFQYWHPVVVGIGVSTHDR